MTRFTLLPVVAACLLSACGANSSAPSRPMMTEKKVEVSRYAGKWYEIARYPKWFQRGCVSATAEYSLNPGGSIRVLNTCLKANGESRSVEGLATPVDDDANRLQVSFPGRWYSPLIPISKEGNYWIIDVSPGYRHAIVGTPDRKSLWFLSRAPSIPKRDFEKMKATAAGQGFDTSKLIIDGHTRLVD